MKIAILTPTFSKFSGPDRVVEDEARKLSKDNQVTIVTFSSDLKIEGVKTIILGSPKSPLKERLYKWFFFFQVGKINNVVEELKDFDKAISFLYPMTIIASKLKKKHNVEYTYYDMGIAYPKLFPSIQEKIAMHLFKLFTKMSVKNADHAISISKFLQSELKKETGLKSEVKYVSIDKNRFNKKISQEKAKEIKKKYSIKGKMLLYVGRISPHKGIHLLIEAFKIYNHQNPDAKLVIIGKKTFGAYSKKLEKISNENVIFTGFVDDEDLPYYYMATDLYVTASLWEGFDMPIVEAQEVGKKVVAFDVGSHKEVIDKNGILVKNIDPKQFAKAIVQLLH